MDTRDFKTDLRQKAKKKLNHSSIEIDAMDRGAVNNLVEELQIHQIELEIQNEELRNTQLTAEALKNRYLSLFENAPNGYVILDASGIIKEFNTAFAAMLPTDNILNSRNQAFADLLAESDAVIFRSKFKALFKHPEGKQAIYRLKSGNRKTIDIQILAKTHTKAFYNTDTDRNEILLMISDITELMSTKTKLKQFLSESEVREKEITALLQGARAVLEQTDFITTSRKLFDICCQIIGSTSGYVALLSEKGDENEVLFLEAGGLPCTVDHDLPMPIRGLREEAYHTNSTVYDNEFMSSEWVKFIPEGHVALNNVMFAPLVINDKTVGVIGLANKEGGFTPEDARIAGGLGELCAIALQNSKNLDKRDIAEANNKKLIGELQAALEDVKQLSGLLPICSHCKKIRDDKGYWNQIESYISKHSDAQFSHGICMDCAKKYYPDYDLD